MPNNPEVQNFIQELIASHESAELLNKAGILTTLTDIFCNKSTSDNTIRAFDLKFADIEKRLNLAKTILSVAQRKNAPDIVQNALISYIFRMTPVVNKTGNGYTGIKANKVAAPDSEPMQRWISTVRSNKRPNPGTRALLCGYWYAGIIEYGVGKWNGQEWECPFDTDPIREFVVLYWSELPPIPESARDEE